MFIGPSTASAPLMASGTASAAELDDSAARLKISPLDAYAPQIMHKALGELLDHPALFEREPRLAALKVDLTMKALPDTPAPPHMTDSGHLVLTHDTIDGPQGLVRVLLAGAQVALDTLNADPRAGTLARAEATAHRRHYTAAERAKSPALII